MCFKCLNSLNSCEDHLRVESLPILLMRKYYIRKGKRLSQDYLDSQWQTQYLTSKSLFIAATSELKVNRMRICVGSSGKREECQGKETLGNDLYTEDPSVGSAESLNWLTSPLRNPEAS